MSLKCIYVCIFTDWYHHDISGLHNFYTWFWNSCGFSVFLSTGDAIHNQAFFVPKVHINVVQLGSAWNENIAKYVYTVCEVVSQVIHPSSCHAYHGLTSVI